MLSNKNLTERTVKIFFVNIQQIWNVPRESFFTASRSDYIYWEQESKESVGIRCQCASDILHQLPPPGCPHTCQSWFQHRPPQTTHYISHTHIRQNKTISKGILGSHRENASARTSFPAECLWFYRPYLHRLNHTGSITGKYNVTHKTSQQVNSAFYTTGVAKPGTSFGWAKVGMPPLPGGR